MSLGLHKRRFLNEKSKQSTETTFGRTGTGAATSQ
jgi:hypothetical protein